MATTIVRTPWIDDDGSGTTGTVLNNAIKTELYNQIDAALATSEADIEFISLTAAPFDNIPLSATKRVHYLNCPIVATVTGCANGKPGDLLIISNATGDPTRHITLPHQSASSAAANRFTNFATSAPTMLAGTTGIVGGTATYVYDSFFNTWRLVSHEQGGWITPPFNASNFTGTSGPWTVEAGDVVTLKYRLSGRTLTVLFNFQNTVNSAVGILTFTYPGGYSAADSPQPHQWTRANTQTGMSQPQGTQLWLWADPAGSGFLAGAIASIQGTAIVEVV
jgi:hypothetical protein